MKRPNVPVTFIILCIFSFIVPLPLSAQTETWKVSRFVEAPRDLDARVNAPEKDINGKVCAIIKVETPFTGFSFDTGLLAVTKTVRKTGEIWVYVSPGVMKLNIYHQEGICRYDIPVKIESAKVYLLKLEDARKVVENVITTAKITSNYLKLRIEPKNVLVRIGRTDRFEMPEEVVSNGYYTRRLDYGEYFYRIENAMYEPAIGKIRVDANSQEQSISLLPAYNTLYVTTLPENGADVFIDGKYIGKSPVTDDNFLVKGEHTLKVVHKDYHTLEQRLVLSGDGSKVTETVQMKPNYAMITCKCDDADAEIWIDGEFKKKGSWTGRLSGLMSHVLEVKKVNHAPQSRVFSVTEGVSSTETIGAPLPLYAFMDISTTPMSARVYIDGVDAGTTPMIKQVLMGNHELKFVLDGYKTKTVNVTLAHNENREVRETLAKGVVYVPVDIRTDKRAHIFVDDEFKGIGSWSGKLPEGEHTFRSVSLGCEDGVQAVSVYGEYTHHINIPAPKKIYGKLTVSSNVNGAKVSIGSVGSSNVEEVGTTPHTVDLPLGDYNVWVSKYRYRTLGNTRKVTVTEGGNHVYFKLKRDYSMSDCDQFAWNYFDTTLGLGVKKGGFHAGFTYARVRKPIGWYTTMMYGSIEGGYYESVYYEDTDITESTYVSSANQGMDIIAGPVFRLTPNKDKVDLQLYAGVGVFAAAKSSFIGDLGFRFSWGSRSSWGLWNFNLGCMYVGGEIVPTFGMGVGISLVGLVTAAGIVLGAANAE